MSKSAREKTKSALISNDGDGPLPQEPSSGPEILKTVLSKPSKVGRSKPAKTEQIKGIVIGTLSQLTESGQALVRYENQPSEAPLQAIVTVPLNEQDIGRDVALSFVEEDPLQPVVLGLIQTIPKPEQTTGEPNVNVQLDGERMVLTADREIVLKCGKSSITLTRAGKVILKGAYLSSRSTGVNRIKGGSVQIN